MQHRRIAVVAAGLALVLVPSTSALAAPPTAGSWSVQQGPRAAGLTSSGSATWDATARTVTLRAEGYGLAAGTCQTTYFDWTSSAKHHDVRGARTCRAGTAASNRWSEPVPVTGVRKLRVCTGPQDELGSCTVHPQATPSPGANWSTARSRNCASWVLVSASGSVSVNSGGDPRRCDA